MPAEETISKGSLYHFPSFSATRRLRTASGASLPVKVAFSLRKWHKFGSVHANESVFRYVEARDPQAFLEYGFHHGSLARSRLYSSYIRGHYVVPDQGRSSVGWTFYSRVFCGRLASVLLRTENELFDHLTCPCRRYLGCRSQVSANTPSLQDHSFKSVGDHLLLWFRSCRTINIALSRRSSGRQLMRSWISWISILDINFR